MPKCNLVSVRIFLVLFAGLLLAGCCGARASLLGGDVGVKAGDAAPLIAQGDDLWAHRGDRAKAEAAIAVWEKAAKLDPTRADVQLRLAYAYYFMANVHARWEEEGEDLMKAYFDKGVRVGEQAIKLTSPEFSKMIADGKTWAEAIPTVGKDGLPALYWYATNLGKWALLDGFVTILRYKDRAAAIMQHCLELDETYFYGAPHRYFGVYRTKIPFPGGDSAASKRHFLKAVEIGPTYLDNKVLFAQKYAVKVGDRDLFDRLLKEVVATSDDVNPDLLPETKNAKRLAKKLLEDADDIF